MLEYQKHELVDADTGRGTKHPLHVLCAREQVDGIGAEAELGNVPVLDGAPGSGSAM